MPLLDIFFAMLYIFLWVAWIVLLMRIIADIFRSPSSGWSKAGWSFFVIFFPFLGVLTYLIVHGNDMTDRENRDAVQAVQAQQDYIRQVAGTSASPADELEKLASLRDSGVISDAEFEKEKKRVLA